MANGTGYTAELSVGGSTRPADGQLYHLPHIYSLPHDDGLLVHPKYVEMC
jgi:hypothetical protein